MGRNAFPVRHLSQRPACYPQAFQHKRWITRACAVSRSASFRCSLDYGASLPHRCTVAQSLMVKVGPRREPSGKGSGPCASPSHCNSGASQRLTAAPYARHRDLLLGIVCPETKSRIALIPSLHLTASPPEHEIERASENLQPTSRRRVKRLESTATAVCSTLRKA
jgi:hypothetical protein